MKYIKLILATITMLSVISFSGVANASNPFVSEACGGVNSVTGGTSPCPSNTNGSSIRELSKKVVDILSVFIGIISVIMIIIAGFKYLTSSGDSNQVASAKNTLIYALIGVAIAVLAQVLVHYVINTASTVQGSSLNKSVIRYDS